MKKTVDFLLNLGDKWWAWTAVISICVLLEGGAVFFQEFLDYYPCEQCVYTRVWMTGIVLVGIVGLISRRNLWARRIVILTEIVLTLGLAQVTWRLLGFDYGFGADGACYMVAQFPSWARLDEWFPTLFMVQEACGPTPEVIFGLTMSDGLAGTCIGFITAFSFAFAGTFVRK